MTSLVRAGAVATFLCSLAGPAAGFDWALDACEPPQVFYSSAHDPAVTTPCCPRNPERCPGGVACVAGTCEAPYDAVPCAAPAGIDAPNIVVVLNDDQGWCHWGFMGPGCRTERQEIVIPSPATPNLDRLVLQPESQGRGRLFEINYSNAAISTPARETLQTGLVSKDLADPNVADRTVAKVLKQPDGPIYCSFGAGGKIGGSRSEETLGYDAFNRRRKWGRYGCTPAPCFPDCDDPPLCGPDLGPAGTPESVQDVFDWIEATLIGPRAPDGSLLPATVYTQAQPFFLWIGSSLPHKPYVPPLAVEDRFRLQPDYLFGESFAHPGSPRFPFGDAAYAAGFDRQVEKSFPGYYGNIWLADDAVRHVRAFLEGIEVWDHTGGTAVSLWERTVFMTTADHGLNMPRAKKNFTENGHRSPLVIHDARLAPSAAETRIERELTHAVDVLPTIADFAGHTPPPGPGQSLRPYLSATPPATPLRDLMCGNRVKGQRARGDRFVRTRPGAVGRCAPASGTSCTTNADCAPGVCLLGTCGTGTRCLVDGDCAGGETCQHATQKWCRFGRNPLTEKGTIAPVDQQPIVPCTTDTDCVADCPAADPLYCTCEYQELRFYSLLSGEPRLMDLFVDPDEPGMSRALRKFGPLPGDLPVGPGDPHAAVAARLKCCLDRWWTPVNAAGVALGDPACTLCEPSQECRRCGDGIVDGAEDCDGANLGGATCATVPGGFGGGALACAAGCAYDVAGCTP